MDKNMNYAQNRNLEEDDIGYESSLYSIEIYDKQFLISLGKERKLLSKPHFFYFPVYLMNKDKVQLQIGAFEYESKNDNKEERLKPYLDNSGDIDLNKLGELILYSFASNDFFNDISLDVTKAIIVELEHKYIYEKVSDNLQVENMESVNEEEEEPFELNENDIHKSEIVKYSDKVLKDGIFTIDKTVKRPEILQEETKEQAKESKKNFRMNRQTEWIEKYMKNNDYDIVETIDQGDCLFDTIRIAYEQIGYKTTISKLRALVSSEANDSMFNEYYELYSNAKSEKDRIESEKRQLFNTNKELKKRVMVTTDKIMKNQLIKEANVIALKYKDLTEELEINKLFLDELRFMDGIESLEQLREFINTPKYWADNWAISILERKLNMKLIMLSEKNFDEGDDENVLLCNLSNIDMDKDHSFNPDFYIFTTYSGNHYRLISYKSKFIFKFSEIPYNIKIMVVRKCMERNSGIFYLIPEFRNFKSTLGIDDEEDEDGEDNEDSENNSIIDGGSSQTIDKKTVFTFYSKSSGLSKVGKGTNEKIDIKNQDQYSFLNLKKNKNWRKMLDDEWKTVFNIDNMKWQSVEQYYQGAKFKKHNPDFYKLFSLDSESDISKDIDLAKIAGSKDGQYKKGDSVTILRPIHIKIDPDFYGPRKIEEREKAIYSKFSQNMDLKAILLATKNATLQKFIPKSKPETDYSLMNVRRQLIREGPNDHY